MEAFMSEISSLDGGTTRVQKPKAPKRKVDDSEIDALTGPQHIDRLVRRHFLFKSINSHTHTHTHTHTGTQVQKNYKWKNLNPFYVLLLPTDVTEEDIKQRLSQIISSCSPGQIDSSSC